MVTRSTPFTKLNKHFVPKNMQSVAPLVFTHCIFVLLLQTSAQPIVWEVKAENSSVQTKHEN